MTIRTNIPHIPHHFCIFLTNFLLQSSPESFSFNHLGTCRWDKRNKNHKNQFNGLKLRLGCNIFLSINQSINQSINLSICLSIYLSFYQSIIYIIYIHTYIIYVINTIYHIYNHVYHTYIYHIYNIIFYLKNKIYFWLPV